MSHYVITRIRTDHTHDGGKVCLVVEQGTHPLTELGVFKVGDVVLYGGYMPYTGHWYLYDAEGREVVSVSRSIWDDSFAKLRLGDLVPDPDCVMSE